MNSSEKDKIASISLEIDTAFKEMSPAGKVKLLEKIRVIIEAQMEDGPGEDDKGYHCC